MLTFFLFLNDIMNVILSKMEKTPRFTITNIVTIQFYNRYFYSKTKIERVLLRLRKRVLSMSHVFKTKTTHGGVTSSQYVLTDIPRPSQIFNHLFTPLTLGIGGIQTNIIIIFPRGRLLVSIKNTHGQ